MRFSSGCRPLAGIKTLFLGGTCGVLYGVGGGCGNMEVQAAVLASLNQLAVGLIDALFLGLAAQGSDGPAPVAAEALQLLTGMLA